MITEHQTVVKLNTANLEGKVELSVCAEKKIASLFIEVFDGENAVYTKGYSVNDDQFADCFTVKNCCLWSITNPQLYSYRLVIDYEKATETVTGRLGFRTLSQNGHHILLNGEPIYVKGYIRGATAHEHPNLLGVSDKEYYRKNITQAKSFGFNFVRFHSVVPCEDFFEMADELGILVHIELRMPNDEYNNLEEMLFAKKDLIPDAFILQTVNRLCNHPSLAVYCIGNEIKNLAEGTRVREIGELIKGNDPDRLYLDTCAWGEAGRPLIDLDVQHMGYFFPYGKHGNIYSDTDNLLVVGNANHALVTVGKNSSAGKVINHHVPLIAHEVCHYVALRDYYALKQKFISHNQPIPWWVDEEIKLIEQKGYADNFSEVFGASKHFQYICWKTAFEQMRASRILGGFHFLQFADTERYENSNGLVDCFDDGTYLSPEEFLTFNGDDVLLTDIDNFIIEGETLKTKISLSRYSESLVQSADFTYSLTDGETVYCSGSLEQIDVAKRDLYDICKLNLSLPKVNRPTELTLEVKLTADGQEFAENQWRLWYFPKQESASYSAFVHYENSDTVITDDIQKALNELEKGKKVCLVYRSLWTRHLLDKEMQNPPYAFRATWNRFKPVIWDRGTNFGGLCQTDILSKYGFVGGRYYDFNYSVLTEDCDKIILDDFPVCPRVIVSGTDKSNRDRFDAYKVSFNLPELMPDRTLRRFGYLFEMQVGEGKLLVCGFNMTGLDSCEPSTVAMSHFILNYMASEDFCPDAKISVDSLRNYMAGCAKAPVKERMMTQYWELDDAPVESKQYWLDSRAYLTEKDK